MDGYFCLRKNAACIRQSAATNVHAETCNIGSGGHTSGLKISYHSFEVQYTFWTAEIGRNYQVGRLLFTSLSV